MSEGTLVTGARGRPMRRQIVFFPAICLKVFFDMSVAGLYWFIDQVRRVLFRTQ
jgi:hypothetical protein